jgi:hypothetical protein
MIRTASKPLPTMVPQSPWCQCRPPRQQFRGMAQARCCSVAPRACHCGMAGLPPGPTNHARVTSLRYDPPWAPGGGPRRRRQRVQGRALLMRGLRGCFQVPRASESIRLDDPSPFGTLWQYANPVVATVCCCATCACPPMHLGTDAHTQTGTPDVAMTRPIAVAMAAVTELCAARMRALGDRAIRVSGVIASVDSEAPPPAADAGAGVACSCAATPAWSSEGASCAACAKRPPRRNRPSLPCRLPGSTLSTTLQQLRLQQCSS